MASPIPATFDQHHGSLGSHYLRDPTKLTSAKKKQVEELVLRLGGDLDPDEQPVINTNKYHLLNQQQCSSLVHQLDKMHRSSKGSSKRTNDFRASITEQQLVVSIGQEAMNKLRVAFAPQKFDTIKLRRVAAAAGAGAGADADATALVPFHTDHAQRILQVSLNDDYMGGELTFVTSKGFQVCKQRPPGSFTIHTKNVVHGVTPLASGTRYSLFLCDTGGESEQQHKRGEDVLSERGARTEEEEEEHVDLSYLVLAVRKQLLFFQNVATTFEEEEDDAVQTYLSKLRNSSPENNHHKQMIACCGGGDEACCGGGDEACCGGGDESSSDALLNLELVWRTHMLRPLLYAQACFTSDVDERALNLVEAVKRQQNFMKKILEKEDTSQITDEQIKATVEQYRHFMHQMSTSSEPKEPSMMVDVVWHTHMQLPERYAKDVKAMVGRMIDHNDEE